MRKAFTLLGLVGIVLSMSCSGFPVSAKEKLEYNKSELSYEAVSRETNVIFVNDILEYTLAVVEETPFTPEVPKDAVVSFVGFPLTRPYMYTDTYLRRSKAWIKWRNLTASGNLYRVKRAKNIDLGTRVLNC
jgi:hypothetical protein